MTEIANPVDGWPYDRIKANWNADKAKWQPVTEDFYYEQLGCLPPIQHKNGAFMVGECYTYDENDAIYCGCIEINGQCYAKYCYEQSFKADCNELREFLNK